MTFPSVNEHGVPLIQVLAQERRIHAELVASLEGALRAWVEAYDAPKNSVERRQRFRVAARLTEQALS